MATAYLAKYDEGVHEEMVRRTAVALAIVAFEQLESPPIDGSKEAAFIKAILTDATAVARSVALDFTSNTNEDHDGSDTILRTTIEAAFGKLAWIFDGTV